MGNPLLCLSDEYWLPLLPESLLTFEAQSLKGFLYYAQIFLELRFQEPQSLEKYAMGERITPLVPIWNIDRVPVTFIHAIGDGRCNFAFAEAMY